MRISWICIILVTMLAIQIASAGSLICEAPRLEKFVKELNHRTSLRKEELITIPYRPELEGTIRQHDLPFEITPSYVY